VLIDCLNLTSYFPVKPIRHYKDFKWVLMLEYFSVVRQSLASFSCFFKEHILTYVHVWWCLTQISSNNTKSSMELSFQYFSFPHKMLVLTELKTILTFDWYLLTQKAIWWSFFIKQCKKEAFSLIYIIFPYVKLSDTIIKVQVSLLKITLEKPMLMCTGEHVPPS
jgi:hypothetical protein